MSSLDPSSNFSPRNYSDVLYSELGRNLDLNALDWILLVY